MSRIRIFVSFDDEHDVDLHDRLRADAERPGAVFEYASRSGGGEMSEAWEASCRSRMRAADEVVVICGVHTEESSRVATELRIAQEEKRPYFLLWGRRERMCTKPSSARPTDAMYSWTWEILQSQILTLRRVVGSTERLVELSRSRAAVRSRTDSPS